MFKYIYLSFFIVALIHKYKGAMKMRKMDKIKGDISYQWLTKLIFIFFTIPYFCPPVEFLLVERDINYHLSGIAFIVYILSWVLSYWARGNLGKYWTVEIEIRKNHPLIKTGPYKYVRHPHYLFLFIEIYCLPLIANAYYSLIPISVILVPAIILRIIYEEKAMIKKFGEEYLQYKKEVWGLFPIPVFKGGVKDETRK